MTELERFRSFLEYCKKKLTWLTNNQAKEIKLTYEKAKPKYGMELGEYARLLEALNFPVGRIQPSHSGKGYRLVMNCPGFSHTTDYNNRFT